MGTRAKLAVLVLILGPAVCVADTRAAGPSLFIRSATVEAERFPTLELRRYLRKITGEQIPTGTQRPEGAIELRVQSLGPPEQWKHCHQDCQPDGLYKSWS